MIITDKYEDYKLIKLPINASTVTGFIIALKLR